MVPPLGWWMLLIKTSPYCSEYLMRYILGSCLRDVFTTSASGRGAHRASGHIARQGMCITTVIRHVTLMETHLWIFIDSSTLCFSGKPRALKNEQMLSAMSFLKCSFPTEIKLCSVHTDPKEWKNEPNISLNHTTNIFNAKNISTVCFSRKRPRALTDEPMSFLKCSYATEIMLTHGSKIW